MKNNLLTFLLFIAISGCSFSRAQDFATSTPHPPPPSPSLTITPLTISTITSSHEPSLTSTFPPYTGKPFSIVFTRNKNLWIANIGEKVTEKQLTFEPHEMRIIDFDVSPDGTRIIYIPYQLDPLNSLIKLVDISTGDTSVILGENDPFSEVKVVWIDNTTIAYKNQRTYTKDNEIITFIVYDLSMNKQLGITDFITMHPSPNLRFWLGCSRWGAEGECGEYTLQNIVDSEQYKLEGEMELGGFIGWSPDSRSMLFNTVTWPPVCTSQLIMVDAETLEQRSITTEDENVWEASFSPTGNFLFYEQLEMGLCQSGEVDYRVLNLDNQQTYEIPVDFQKDVWGFDWTPDGKHLLFFHDSHSSYENELWSMSLTGSDLQPILANVEEFKVLDSIP